MVFNSITNAILANQISSSNTFTFTTNAQWIANSPIYANVVVTDSAPTQASSNSVKSSAITVVTTLGIPTITPSSALTLDAGQSNTIASYETGGSGSLTYNFILFNGITNTVLAFQNGASNTFTFTTNAQWVANSPIYANVLVKDSAPTPTSANSVKSSAITVATALGLPTITPTSPLTLDAGQSNTIASYETGGSGSLTYNFILFNGITNTVLAFQNGASNTFTFTTNAQWVANSPIYANVLVKDSAPTPTSANSVKSSAITVATALGLPTITPTSPLTLDAGQSNTIASYETGGSGSLTYNFILFNGITNTVLAFQNGASNTFTFTTNAQWVANSPIYANVLVKDSAPTPTSANSVKSSAITVATALGLPTITPTSPLTLDAGQSNTIASYETGGSGTLTYNFIVFNSITNTILANQIGASNTFTFTTNAQWIANSPIYANVLVTDTGSATSNTANSVHSSAITVYPALTIPTITPTSPLSLEQASQTQSPHMKAEEREPSHTTS